MDGALVDDFRLTHGCWEAKDIHDDLPAEVDRKFAAGYPRDQYPVSDAAAGDAVAERTTGAGRGFGGRRAADRDATDVLRLPAGRSMRAWEEAVAQFKDRVADIGQGLAQLIQQERKSNRTFTAAFAEFLDKCRQSINPNLAEAAVEEMLIQHLLTERLFRTVFNRPAFTRRNVIAFEIENCDRRAYLSFLQPRRIFEQPGPLLCRDRAHGGDDPRLFAEATFSEHRLRTVFPGLFDQGGGIRTALSTHRSRSSTSWCGAWPRSWSGSLAGRWRTRACTSSTPS